MHAQVVINQYNTCEMHVEALQEHSYVQKTNAAGCSLAAAVRRKGASGSFRSERLAKGPLRQGEPAISVHVQSIEARLAFRFRGGQRQRTDGRLAT